MNLLLLEEADFIAADRVILRDRRLVHMQEVHRAAVGDSLRVGRIGGLMGNAKLLRLESGEAELQISLDQPPPAKLPLTLLLALPRPKMLRRVLQTVASMGVPRVVLVNSYRVEKSFWQTPFLEPEAVREQLILGLEQARDTVLPEIIIEKRFKPFVEDRLPALAQGTLGLVGHPGDYPSCPRGLDQPVTLAIGPEGGWIPYEVTCWPRPACSRCNWARGSCVWKLPLPRCSLASSDSAPPNTTKPATTGLCVATESRLHADILRISPSLVQGSPPHVPLVS